jgi:hypothetical protein
MAGSRWPMRQPERALRSSATAAHAAFRLSAVSRCARGRRSRSRSAALTYRHQMREPRTAFARCDSTTLSNAPLEPEIVLRRLTTLLVLSFVVLGMTTPALACAVASTQHDCCPDGSTAPCSGETPSIDSSGPVAACCVVAPPTSVLNGASGAQAEQPKHSSAPDPFLTAAWLAALTSTHLSSTPTPAVIPVRTDGELTYLRTGRLRL